MRRTAKRMAPPRMRKARAAPMPIRIHMFIPHGSGSGIGLGLPIAAVFGRIAEDEAAVEIEVDVKEEAS